MDIIEHPLEAIAFRLYSLPDASASGGAAAWTCLAAVLAAAMAAGLWRLRSSAPADGTDALKPLELEPFDAKDMSPDTTTNSSAPSPDSAATTAAPAPKERYTAYYRVGCCDVDGEEGYSDAEEEDAEEEGDDDGAYQTSAAATDPFGWETVRSSSLPRSPTAAEVGRNRSPTERSGSVVRLWDEAVDAGVSPRRWRGRVVVSAFSAELNTRKEQ